MWGLLWTDGNVVERCEVLSAPALSTLTWSVLRDVNFTSIHFFCCIIFLFLNFLFKVVLGSQQNEGEGAEISRVPRSYTHGRPRYQRLHQVNVGYHG